jgi:hypothetical protein
MGGDAAWCGEHLRDDFEGPASEADGSLSLGGSACRSTSWSLSVANAVERQAASEDPAS